MYKRWKGIRRLICLILIGGMLGDMVGMPRVQAQASFGENTVTTERATAWDGINKEKTWELERCQVTYLLNDCWDSGYTVTVMVENTSDTVIENWHIAFPIEAEIKSLWNAQIVKTEQSGAVFKNVGWNQDIASGQSVQFGFTVEGAFAGFPEICELPGTLQAVLGEDAEFAYKVAESWESGFKGIISINNKSGRTIEDWQISFDLPYEITDLWEGQLVSKENDRYVVKNNSYNQNIAPDGVVTIGFTVQNGDAETEPTNYLLEEVTLSEATSDGDDLEEVVLTIDTKDFDYNETGEFYLTKEKLNRLSGTLTGAKQVEKLMFIVTDIKENMIDSGEISIQENWEIMPFGLALGSNCITVKAYLKGGKIKEKQIFLVNFNAENMDAADLDLSDTDGDGISNYYETIFDTDMLLEDTDGDGLKDFDEMIKTGTDPRLMDTDGNGVNDAEEDFDEDGLINSEEMTVGSGPLYRDTDNDGLEDGEEVEIYFTSPVEEDTDEDGLKDGDDVRLSYDPTNPDTDGDGILDGNEISYQTYTKQLDHEKKAGITQISVAMDCVGCIDNEVYIHNVYNLDMRTTEVEGLFGAPVTIETREEFEEATITFTYDETVLGETSEDNLRIMWYDEENDRYIILDDETVLDKENNTLSYTTDHFSTWLVVDRTIWYDALRQDINYRTGEDIVYYDIAMVVDVSLSMQNNNRFPLAKSALNSLIDGMLEGDNAGLIRYNETATVVQSLTDDKEALKAGVEKLSLRYGNDADMGISAGIKMLCDTNGTNRRMLVLICDGDVKYNVALVQLAKANQIPIYCINVVDGNADAMESIAINTGGQYYYAATSEDIKVAMSELKGDTVSSVDETDSDGDGLYDVYEINGMRMSNGTIVYTDPTLEDTDGDGIDDYHEMGGEPKEVTYTVGDKTFTSVMNPGALYDKLPRDFMYVDGRPNLNGMVVDSKLDYVPYLNKNLIEWYLGDPWVETTHEHWGESKPYKGIANIHGLFADKMDELSTEQLLQYWTLNAIVFNVVDRMAMAMAKECFRTYVFEDGGSMLGIEGMGTRKYVNVDNLIKGGMVNSAHENFMINIYSAMIAAETVLNQYDTEVYFAVAPESCWSGCYYHNTTDLSNIEQNIGALANIDAFGTFNKADAVATLHCTYDPQTKMYEMEYIYYLTDYYDFSFAEWLQEQDALGLCRSYELYGRGAGSVLWQKEQGYFVMI